MEEHILNAKQRIITGRKTNQLRANSDIPAVVYGAGIEPTNITIDHNSFLKTYKSAGESTIVSLVIDGKEPIHALIHALQFDPIMSVVNHVDFRSIDMNKEIETSVELEFINEAPAVKALGGTLVTSRDSLTIKCLPAKFVRNIKVDLSKLVNFGDVIRVKDLTIPEGIVIIEEPGLSIAVATAPRSEEEMAELDKAVDIDVSAIEVAGKKEKEEEGEEGEKGKEADEEQKEKPAK